MAQGIDVPEKLFRIGEIVEHTGLSRQTIHNYTVWGLITEVRRTRGNHRLYGEGVFCRLDRIRRLKESHTLGEIRRILEGATEAGSAQHVGESVPGRGEE